MTLIDADVGRVARALPMHGRTLLQNFSNIWCAGGFVRAILSGQQPSDCDLFGTEGGLKAAVSYTKGAYSADYLHESEQALTVKGYPVPTQIITSLPADNPTQTLENFDFTVCQAAVWWNLKKVEWQSRVYPMFYVDLYAKMLNMNPNRRAVSALTLLQRVLKYERLGFQCSKEALVDITVAMGKDAKDREIAELKQELKRRILYGG